VRDLASQLIAVGQRNKADYFTDQLLQQAERYIAYGTELPPHEVNCEQSMVAPRSTCSCPPTSSTRNGSRPRSCADGCRGSPPLPLASPTRSCGTCRRGPHDRLRHGAGRALEGAPPDRHGRVAPERHHRHTGLTAECPPGDVCARIGGEEFAPSAVRHLARGWRRLRGAGGPAARDRAGRRRRAFHGQRKGGEPRPGRRRPRAADARRGPRALRGHGGGAATAPT
jgi:hypothetical protein